MGINLSIQRNTHEIDKYHYLQFKNVSEEVGFDGLRYGGDRDFDSAPIFDDYISEYTKEEQPYTYYEIYKRPTDFEKAKQWVKDNIVEINQKRLLDVLDIMEKDKDLYFHASY